MMKSKKQPISDLTAVLAILGGRWKVFILDQLTQGTRRFGELKKAIPAVTQKMLTQELRDLEESGLVARRVYSEVPPRVEYSLTDHGSTIGPLLCALNEWGSFHLQHLQLEAAALNQQEENLASAPIPEPEARPSPAPRPLVSSFSHEALTEAVRAAAM